MSTLLLLWFLFGMALGLTLYGLVRLDSAEYWIKVVGADPSEVEDERAQAQAILLTALVLAAFAAVIFWLDYWGVL